MATVLNLNRSAYLQQDTEAQTLDYLSAKYLNIKYIIPAKQSFKVTQAFVANAPGIAHQVYGSSDYWWIVMIFNGILDPIEELAPGTSLQLPRLADINAFLSSKESDAQDLTTTI